MLAYALVVARPGRRVPPDVTAALRDARPSEVPFTCEAHTFWQDDEGRTQYGGWERASAAFPAGRHHAIRPAGLTAFSGLLWPIGTAWRPDADWAVQLSERFAAHPLHQSLDGYQGVYTAVSVTADGDGRVATDPMAFGALYRAESADVVVVSTRSDLAARLVAPPGIAVARDVVAMASLAYCTYALEQRTGFVGVSVVAPGTCLLLSQIHGPRWHTWSAHPWLPVDPPCVDALSDIVDEIRTELTATVRAQASVPGSGKLANLTGGKDSRLVLALLLDAGLTDEFVFNTFGSPTLPDNVVAGEVAERFGLHRQAAPPPQVTGTASDASTPTASLTYGDRLRHHLWATTGLLSTWDLRSPIRPRPRALVLTGLFGETYAWSTGIPDRSDPT